MELSWSHREPCWSRNGWAGLSPFPFHVSRCSFNRQVCPSCRRTIVNHCEWCLVTLMQLAGWGNACIGTTLLGTATGDTKTPQSINDVPPPWAHDRPTFQPHFLVKEYRSAPRSLLRYAYRKCLRLLFTLKLYGTMRSRLPSCGHAATRS